MLLLATTHKYGNDISKICQMKPVDDTEEYCSTILCKNFIIRNTVLQMHQLHIYLQILKEYLNPNFACKTGFNFDGGKCYDIDECSLDSFICPALSGCVNTPGSYECKCVNGYQASGQITVSQ